MKPSKILSFLLVLIMVVTSFSFADITKVGSEVTVRVLIDNASIRVVESISGSEKSVATFNKITNSLVIDTVDIRNKAKSELKLDHMVSQINKELIAINQSFSYE